MNRLFKIIHSQKGFSLVEIMVAVGLLGVVSLAVMQMNSTMMKGQVTSEVKMEGIEIRRQIVTNMVDKLACENTLAGSNLGGSVTSIKNSANAEIFAVGRKYGSNALLLESIEVLDKGDLGGGMRDAELQVNFKSLKKAAYGSTNKSFKSRLKVKASGSTGVITECFDDSSGTISAANEAACISMDGVWDSATNTCNVNHFVRKTGDVMTGGLETPSLVNTGAIQTNSISATTTVSADNITSSTRVTSPTFCTGTNCKAIGDLALSNQACANGYVSDGVNTDGTVRCKALQCPANQFFAGLDNSGNALCRPYPTNTCPTSEYVSEVKPNGTVVCELIPNNANAVCPTGQVLQSINAGTPSCITSTDTNVFGKSCATGFSLQGFANDGSPICVVNSVVQSVQTFTLFKAGGSSASTSIGVWSYCALSSVKTTEDDENNYDNCYVTGSLNSNWTLGLTKHSADTLECRATCFK